jgi:uncharacterized protein
VRTVFFFTIFLGLPLLDAIWWRWADRALRPLRRAKIWRSLLAAFMLFQLSMYAAVVIFRRTGLRLESPPTLLAYVYLWHLFILPATIVIWIAAGSAIKARDWLRRRVLDGPATSAERSTTLTRRQLLAATAVAVPPLMSGGLIAYAAPQWSRFRIRRITVPMVNLPAALDGLTIAHLSDVHVGRFTRPHHLPAIAEATNALRTDLVCMTGDLIDFSMADLPAALDFMKKLDPRNGLFMCEGNHDLFEDHIGFEETVIKAGIPLLLNESATARVRGQDIQVMGIRWGSPSAARENRLKEHTQATVALRSPDAFSILLAHHPHAFDRAASGGAGVNLTLAGHTHGGQLMLSENAGIGPIMFKYWSGLYRRGDHALVVSNGVGNWFPLRVHAPAEIVHITLRKA